MDNETNLVKKIKPRINILVVDDDESTLDILKAYWQESISI